MSTKRLIVTIPEEDYKRLEREKKEKGINRSKFVSNIIETFFQYEDEEKKEIQYVSGYKKKPEKVKEIESFEKAAAEVIGEF
ncbi:MAG: hypothetical protein U9R36_00900 [Elusimicrobiota bacterium]|nr:hypothetical protein [Elusimicrobiota bacterium]